MPPSHHIFSTSFFPLQLARGQRRNSWLCSPFCTAHSEEALAFTLRVASSQRRTALSLRFGQHDFSQGSRFSPLPLDPPDPIPKSHPWFCSRPPAKALSLNLISWGPYRSSTSNVPLPTGTYQDSRRISCQARTHSQHIFLRTRDVHRNQERKYPSNKDKTRHHYETYNHPKPRSLQTSIKVQSITAWTI